MPPLLEVFFRFAKLGLTSFGGPFAHLGYFRREFVERAKWLDDAAYAEIVALCTALPGPTSSQVGMLLGARRAGPLGAVLAWLAFSAPSAFVLGAFGIVLTDNMRDLYRHVHVRPIHPWVGPIYAWIRNGHAGIFSAAMAALTALAVAVVANAVVQMTKTLATTTFTRVLAVFGFVSALALNAAHAGLGAAILPVAAFAGVRFASHATLGARETPICVSRNVGIAAAIFLGAILVAAIVIPANEAPWRTVSACIRAGALVFGGGHVVLSFLSGLVGHGMNAPDFAAGYGAAQVMPGPLFTFAAFAGAADVNDDHPVAGAILATVAIFAPSFLTLPAAVALWGKLRALPAAGAALTGIDAGVTGLLAATFVTLAVSVAPQLAERYVDRALPFVAFVLLWRFKVAVWIVAVICIAAVVADTTFFPNTRW